MEDYNIFPLFIFTILILDLNQIYISYVNNFTVNDKSHYYLHCGDLIIFKDIKIWFKSNWDYSDPAADYISTANAYRKTIVNIA